RRRGPSAHERQPAPRQDRDPGRRSAGRSGQDGRRPGRDSRRDRLAVEASTKGGGTRVSGVDTKLIEAVTIRLKATPFRADKLALAYLREVPKVMDYGALGYSFMREEDDSHHFLHVSYWNDRSDFEQWWFSFEMQNLRQEIQGVHDEPMLPHWNQVIEVS